MSIECKDIHKYYSLLDCNEHSSIEEIKKQYKTKAKQFHPDRNNGNDAHFLEIKDAYDVLSDPYKKRLYDNNSLNQYEDTILYDVNPNIHVFMDNLFTFEFDDFVKDIFAHSNRTRKDNTSMKPCQQLLELNINDIIYGCTKTISYVSAKECKNCNSTGYTHTKFISCMYCKGIGYIHSIPFPLICERCNGRSKIQTDLKRCNVCKGEKIIKKNVVYEVDIPSGQENNSTVNIQEDNICLTFKHTLDDKIKIKNKTDVYIKHYITIEEMLCGFEHVIEVGNKDNPIQIQQSGYFDVSNPFVYEGIGVINKDKQSRGDVYVKIYVKGTRNENKMIKYKKAFVKIFSTS